MLTTKSASQLGQNLSTEETKTFNKIQQSKSTISKFLQKLTGDNNVLILGAHNVGKSSLINSLWLAMTGETEERSPPVGIPYNYQAVPLYSRRATKSRLHGNLTMWDTRGLQKVQNESLLASIFRFILEGRFDESYFKQSLIIEEKKIKKNCKKKQPCLNNFFKAIIFIERHDADDIMRIQTEKLARVLRLALSRSHWNAVKNIPILRVLNGVELDCKVGLSSVSSVESLCSIGLPALAHTVENYEWKIKFSNVNVEEGEIDEGFLTAGSSESIEVFDDENDLGKRDEKNINDETSDNDPEQVVENSTVGKSRFEYAYRQGPENTSLDKDLNLLLFLQNLLDCVSNPNSSEHRKWRFDREYINVSDQGAFNSAMESLKRNKEMIIRQLKSN